MTAKHAEGPTPFGQGVLEVGQPSVMIVDNEC